MSKVAAIVQAKNESAIISHQLDILGLFCDKIFVVDDNSEDNTTELAANHKHKRTTVLTTDSEKRTEGADFIKAFTLAKSEGFDRIYISDCDEIPTPDSISTLRFILRKTQQNVRIHRAELALDQKTVYGENDGLGKLIIINTEDATFNPSMVIHASQPDLNKPSVEYPFSKCCLLHYGTCDYAYQVFKCLSYIMWENEWMGKDINKGYQEYFKMYNNFVNSTNQIATRHIWSQGELQSPIPYKHYLDEETRDFCNNINAFDDFDISNVVENFVKIPYVNEKVCNRGA